MKAPTCAGSVLKAVTSRIAPGPFHSDVRCLAHLRREIGRSSVVDMTGEAPVFMSPDEWEARVAQAVLARR